MKHFNYGRFMLEATHTIVYLPIYIAIAIFACLAHFGTQLYYDFQNNKAQR